jgi:hypothetical protein
MKRVRVTIDFDVPDEALAIKEARELYKHSQKARHGLPLRPSPARMIATVTDAVMELAGEADQSEYAKRAGVEMVGMIGAEPVDVPQETDALAAMPTPGGVQ